MSFAVTTSLHPDDMLDIYEQAAAMRRVFPGLTGDRWFPHGARIQCESCITLIEPLRRRCTFCERSAA